MEKIVVKFSLMIKKKKNENIISVNEHKMKHTILVENQMKDCCLFYGIS